MALIHDAILTSFMSFSFVLIAAGETTTTKAAPAAAKAKKDLSTMTKQELEALPAETLEEETNTLKTQLTEAEKNLAALQKSFKEQCLTLQNKINNCPAQYHLDGGSPLNYFGCSGSGGKGPLQTVQISMSGGGTKSFVLDTGDYISDPFVPGDTSIVFKSKNGTDVNPKRFLDITVLDLRAVKVESTTKAIEPDDRPPSKGLSIEISINKQSLGKFSFIEPLDASDNSKLIVDPKDILALSRLPSCQ